MYNYICTKNISGYIWQVFWHSLTFYLTCIQFFMRILSETWHSIWHCIWHILWHSIWNSIPTLFDKYSDIPFGIYCEFLLRSYWHSIWHFVWLATESRRSRRSVRFRRGHTIEWLHAAWTVGAPTCCKYRWNGNFRLQNGANSKELKQTELNP